MLSDWRMYLIPGIIEKKGKKIARRYMPICLPTEVDKGGRRNFRPQYGQKKYVGLTGF